MIINRDTIQANIQKIRRYVRRTPMMYAHSSDFGLPFDNPLVFKLEFLQHAGSFKTRGAFTHLLTRPIPKAGVVAASGGNHGAAVAYAAHKRNIPATIFIPTIASQAKVDRIRSYGANLVIDGERYADALAASEQFVSQSGAAAIHAYDQPETLLGQGSVGFELEQDASIDTLLVAVGGGGLIAGIAAWYEERVRLIGVEPELAPTLTRALEAGRPVNAPAGGIAADSLAPKQVGQLVFPFMQRYLDRTVLVSDDAILHSQRLLWDVLRVASEPGGAAAFSALLDGRFVPEPGESVGILLCGANTTAVSFP